MVNLREDQPNSVSAIVLFNEFIPKKKQQQQSVEMWCQPVWKTDCQSKYFRLLSHLIHPQCSIQLGEVLEADLIERKLLKF